MEAKIESDAVQTANKKETVDAGIEQDHFVEDGQVWWPCGLEPAQVNRETKGEEDEIVSPIAGLMLVDVSGVLQEERDGDREQSVESEPVPKEAGGSCAYDEIWKAKY